jgi:hypothetical protein
MIDVLYIHHGHSSTFGVSGSVFTAGAYSTTSDY